MSAAAGVAAEGVCVPWCVACQCCQGERRTEAISGWERYIETKGRGWQDEGREGGKLGEAGSGEERESRVRREMTEEGRNGVDENELR